jgi:hypothetical protein
VKVQPSQLGVLPADRVYPAVKGADDPRARPLHLHGLGQIAKPVEKAAHRGLGGGAATLGAADAVGDCGDHLLAGLRQFGPHQRAGEILVGPARAGLRSKADYRANASLDRGHGAGSAGLPLSRYTGQVPLRKFAKFGNILDAYKRINHMPKY